MTSRRGPEPKKPDWTPEKAVTVLRHQLAELEIMLPEGELKGTYDSGDEFAFYVDLKGILASAARDVFVVDNYLDSEFFELYAAPIPKSASVRIVTDVI